jgi:hypothetical protein
LRGALLRAADCLLTTNRYFRSLAAQWAEAGRDARWARVKVASRLCRILYEMVAGQQVFCHPKYKGRHCILKKLAAFHREHESAAAALGRDLDTVLGQVPAAEYAAEARALEPLAQRRGRGAKELQEMLPQVLTRLGAKQVQSRESKKASPR